MPAGRPTKLNEEMRKAADDYIANYAKYNDIIPSVVGMACHLNVAKSTLYKWASDESAKFSDTLEKCEDYQHRKLLNAGLNNEFNPTITKLALANHGYSEKTDNTLSGPGGGPIETDNTWKVTILEPDTSKT